MVYYSSPRIWCCRIEYCWVIGHLSVGEKGYYIIDSSLTMWLKYLFILKYLQLKEDLISYLKVLDTWAMLARLLLSRSWSMWQTTERGIFLKVKSFESSKDLPIIEKKYLLYISTHWVWSGEGKEVSTSMMVNSIWGEFQVWILLAFYTRPIIMDYSYSSFLFSSVKTRVNLTFSLFSDLGQQSARNFH